MSDNEHGEKSALEAVPTKIGAKHLFWATLLGVGVFAGLLVFVWWIGGRPDADRWFDLVVRSAVFAFVSLGLIPAGYIAFRRQRTLEQQRRDDREMRADDLGKLSFEKAKETSRIAEAAQARAELEEAEQRRVEELALENARALAREFQARFTEAAAQLGHDKAAIRLAGVYAMSLLADEWGAAEPEHRQTCIDVLCAYVRLPFPNAGQHATNATNGSAAAADATFAPDETELRVRETVLRSINTHLQSSATHSWSEADFDFTGAYFPDDIARFDGAVFAGARTCFDRAQFSGSQTSFDGATFSGEVTSFVGALFSAARTSFDMATFSGGRTTFSTATFSGWDISFHDTTFSGAQTSFDTATFSGRDMSFDMATFSGARTSFDAVKFACARTSFFGATFSGEFTTFGGSTFTGDDTTFYLAKFRGARMSFLGARFSGAHTSFNAVVGSPVRGTTSVVQLHARIDSVLDFSDVQQEGRADLDLSEAEVVGSGNIIAPKDFASWKPPSAAAAAPPPARAARAARKS